MYLEHHPHHASAVTATLTGSSTHLARALLSKHGFRQTDNRTMLLVRIDHEEPHYADEAARAVRQEGITVEIAPGLKEAISTEWAWATHPMPLLNREEIRNVSDDAQKIYDDIAEGRLTVHLHANDGWTVVAVGTYRDGKSVHLHGEDHVRVIASVYESPARAIAEFQRLNGDTVRPGPAPATDTDTEREAAALLATTTTTGTPLTEQTETTPAPEPARMELVPVYAADPGDHEAFLASFLEEQGEWEKYRTWDDSTTIANHESLTLRAEFEHDTGPRDTNWTIAAYESPVGERVWHATATAGTPVEIVQTLLDAIASHPDSPTDLRDAVSEQIVARSIRPLTDGGWKRSADGRRISWGPPNGEAAGVEFDAFAAQSRGNSIPTWVIWGGNTVDRPTWALHASAHTPAVILEALTFTLDQVQAHRRIPAAPGQKTPLSTPAPVPPSLLSSTSPSQTRRCR
ncbi:DUF317 domain-containing protein [Streptomyces sp. SID1121]|uniref:DUF317 domain-containing protein n=1 Tax=Streptomyces sp. SID1121 TaxID=3425888 RepID=UPI0040578703